ncbi:MAG: RNA-directed DNA polymerase [Clostridia bacterium]|nr:RNA-directed DNA polymerase [Clostridia bacterium]
MKRIGNLYEQLLDIERIKEIIILAAKGKRKRKNVLHVLESIDLFAEEMLDMLTSGEYYLAPTHNKTIMERGKERVLTISPFFPNRVLDYIMVETLKPFIKKSMYEYCVGNVNGRGIRYGERAIKRKYKRYKYYIKLDIRKFYPSVSSENMCAFIESKIKDARFLKLCEFVIKSETCLPIGSYYSQWFSNWYLQDADHAIKEKFGVPFYIRYVDDMLFMGNNKRQLKAAAYATKRLLKTLGLDLKRIPAVKQAKDEPIDFLGYRFCESRMKLRKAIFKRLNKRIKKIRKTKHVCLSQAQSLLSYIGWLKDADGGYLYYKRYIKTAISKGLLRRVASKSDVYCLECARRGKCKNPCRPLEKQIRQDFGI